MDQYYFVHVQCIIASNIIVIFAIDIYDWPKHVSFYICFPCYVLYLVVIPCIVNSIQ